MTTPSISRKGRKWPRKVTAGNVSVTVYKVKHATNRSGWAYEVARHTPEGRKKQKFADESAAMTEARVIAAGLQAGRVEGAELSRGERDAYVAARKLVESEDYPLLGALEEWAKARAICGSHLLVAAKEWKDANGGGRREITVTDLVKAFLRDKERSGVDINAGYARTLPIVTKAFGDRHVHTLTAHELKEWLHSEFIVKGEKRVNASTFNSHRKRMLTVWKWARAMGYLPKNAQTEIEQVPRLKEESLQIGILTVEQFSAVLRLIKSKHPAYLATTVLAGFCGLRRTELHAQKWSDIDLKRRLLRVTKAKRNTPAMRLVHLCPSAVEWLMLCKRDGELVSPSWAVDMVRKHAQEAKISCPPNAFRHSFITYLVGATSDVPKTSLEAGNSPDLIFRHYRELVAKDEGEAWFALTPKSVEEMGKVTELAEAAS